MRTFEAFKGVPAGNYSSMPTIDVEILPPAGHRCVDCDAEIKFHMPTFSWSHLDEAAADHGRVSPGRVCHYCNNRNQDEVIFSFQSYSDQIECSRCGGITGRPIGD